MKKRAQFFIIFAVIFGIIILSLATLYNTIIKTGREETAQKTFNLMCENYNYEIFKTSEYAISSDNKDNEPELIKNFTIDFLDNSKNNDPNFQLIYVYGNNNKINILHSMGDSITIDPEPTSWESVNGYLYGKITGVIDSITISGKINKQYIVVSNERFWFVVLTEKENEVYICE